MSLFDKRLNERKEELEWLYRELYTDRWYLDQLENRMKEFYEERNEDLKLLDDKREGSVWYLDRSTLAITMYTDLFSHDLKALIEKIPYLKEIGITYLHLMPLLKMPQSNNDGGYAISDFNEVDERFGSNEDLVELTRCLRAEGISLCLDFVMNHTSSVHQWAQLAKNGNEEYQIRYMCYNDRTIPNLYEKTVPEVFPSTAPGNFTYSDEMRKWVFTSFYPFQWDLNYRNPVVLNEMIYSMLRLANMGVEVFRLDAVPYIWKEIGTNCRNLPKVHTIVRIIRLVLECVCPGVILKGEVVMAPKELAAYFGTEEKPECHLLYNVSLMINLWSALASQDVRLLKSQVEAILSLPPNCEFLNYLRCHDDIGWGLDEDEERRLGIDPLEHKKFLYKFYQGSFPYSYSKGELYNYDPETQDARSCGTTASLCGIEKALCDNDDEELSKAISRFKLMYAAAFALKGFPMLNSGDEIGQLNDYSYHQNPLLYADSRNLHRSPFDWEKAEKRKEKGSLEETLFGFIKELVKVKSSSRFFDKKVLVSTWDSNNERIFALKRELDNEDMLLVFSFSDDKEDCHFNYFMGEYVDLFTGRKVFPGLGFDMESHEFMYLVKVKK